MDSRRNRIANFIIAGTEKAGTTSVYTYLGQHPEVCCSSRKETDFFRTEYSGDPGTDVERYSRFFSRCAWDVPVTAEASPGYLGEAEIVAPRIASMIPDARLLFILRDPVERLYSSYAFHVGRLNIDAEISFADYVQKCLAFYEGKGSEDDLGIDRWYLDVLRFGRYSEFLEHYFASFPARNLKVMFFDDLKSDTPAFMKELSRFLDIDSGFWDSFDFWRTNVTFSARNKTLHKMALAVNNGAETLLRRHPRFKKSLVDIYKKLNAGQRAEDPIPANILQQLHDFYDPTNQALARMLGRELPGAWLSRAETEAASA